MNFWLCHPAIESIKQYNISEMTHECDTNITLEEVQDAFMVCQVNSAKTSSKLYPFILQTLSETIQMGKLPQLLLGIISLIPKPHKIYF